MSFDNDDLFNWNDTPEITFAGDPLAKAPYAECSTCPLLPFACVPNYIPQATPELIIVGETPGYHEVQQRKPFVGPSGQLLDAVLAHIGIDTTAVYKTNAVLCHPPNNDLSRYPDAVKACSKRLETELNAIECNTVVAMGNTAVQALDVISGVVNKDGIIKRRGNWYPYGTDTSEWNDRSYLATLHPAFVLRQTGYISQLLADMRSIQLEPTIDWHNIKYTVVTLDNLIYFTQQLRTWEANKTVVSFDVETPNLVDKTLLELYITDRSDHAWIVPGTLLRHDPLLVKFLDQCFGYAKLVAHNGKFDQQVLYHNGMQPFNLTDDTMLMHYALDEQKGTHDLKQLATTFLGVYDYEAELIDTHFRNMERKDRDYSTIPTEQRYRYGAIDACATLELQKLFNPLIDADNVRQSYQIRIDASNALQYTEAWGITVDVEYLKKVHYHLINAIGEAESNIQLDAIDYTKPFLAQFDAAEIALLPRANWLKGTAKQTPRQQYRRVLEKIIYGDKQNKGVNLSSWQQMQVLLYDVLQLKHIKKLGWKTDPRSTNAEALDALQPHPFVGVLQEYRRLDKIRGTYVEKLLALADSEDRVHVRYNLHGTECITGDSIVWNSHGQTTAESMWLEKRLDVYPNNAARIYKSETPVQVFKITTQGSYHLKCTPNHKFMTNRGWVRADELTTTDQALIWLQGGAFNHGGDQLRDDQALMLGILVADGFWKINTTTGHYALFVASSDLNVIEILIRNKFVKSTKTIDIWELSGKQQIQCWLDIFPYVNGAYNKTIPWCIQEGTRSDTLAFLRGYSCDAYIGVSNNGTRNPRGVKQIKYSTTSKQLAYQLQNTLLRLGYPSRIQFELRDRPNAHHTTEDIFIEHQCTVIIQGEKAVALLTEMGEPLRQTHIDRLALSDWYTPYPKQKPATQWRKITSIIALTTPEYVYDFTVPDRSAYVVNGLYVHNTGRLSANDGLHGIPRPSDIWGQALRGSFIAKPGYKIGKCDYAQAELRVFAALSNERFLIDMFANREDPHGNITLLVFGNDPRFLGMTKESYNKDTEKWSLPQVNGYTEEDQKNYWKEQRTTGKNVVFGGLVYQGKAPGIVAMISAQTGKYVDTKLVDYVLTIMLNQMPNAAQWQKDQFRYARDNHYVQTRLGSKRRFMVITEENLEEVKKACVNAPVQGVVAELLLLAGTELTNKGVRVLMYNHDELVFEMLESEAESTAALVRDTMVNTAAKHFPEVSWRADVSIGDKWYNKRPEF